MFLIASHELYSTSFAFSLKGSTGMHVKVGLDARTQLGYLPKTKAENIKSFGNIFDQILEIQSKTE